MDQPTRSRISVICAGIGGVLLAVAPVIGLGRVVAAAPGVAGGFGYDIEAALENPGGH